MIRSARQSPAMDKDHYITTDGQKGNCRILSILGGITKTMTSSSNSHKQWICIIHFLYTCGDSVKASPKSMGFATMNALMTRGVSNTFNI